MNNSISLSDKLLNGEKVQCMKCKKGIYVPQNKEYTINHYYHCNMCNDTVILEPLVEIE